MADVVKRLNYFDHQFLRAPDFNDEQKYHLNMQRRHNTLLHTWGIAQGLTVTLATGGTGTAVAVSAGVAIDSLGQEMVLATDTNLELGGVAASAIAYITIAYNEQQSDPTTEAGGQGYTRWTEAPKLAFSTAAPTDASMTLILGKVPRTATGLGTIDSSDRRVAGVVVSPDLTVNSLTLKKDGVAQSAWPKLSCPAANQAALAGGSLSLDAQSEVFFSDGGQIRSFDNNHRLVFNRSQSLMDLYESGDIRFLTGNGLTEKMRVQASGNVGIGTATPAASLDVASGILHVAGNPNPTTTSQGAYLGWNALTGGTGETDFINNQGAGPGGFAFMNTPASGTPRTTLMVITGGGNVGVGTGSPQTKLQIGKLTSVDEGGTAAGAWANFGSNAHFDGAWKRIDATKAGVNFHMNADDGAGQEFRFQRVEADGTKQRNLAVIGSAVTCFLEGNVGIGTSTPAYTLDVKAKGIKLGLEANGGGQLVIVNNPNDNKVWLEAFDTTGTANAAEFLLTGRNGGNVPQLTFAADHTQANGDLRLANSDLYFTKTDHNHTGFGNTPGFAAIENTASHSALMILGRSTGPSAANPQRVVKLWDFLQVNGDLEVAAGGLLHVDGNTSPKVASQGAYLGWNALTGGTGETDFINNQGGGSGGFAFMNTPASGTPRTTIVLIDGSGRLGVFGQPAAPRTPGWGGGIHTWDLEAEGTIWARNGSQSGNRDLAENYLSDLDLQIGEVVCLDRDQDRIVRSQKANDELVLGVISAEPGFLLNANPGVEDQANDKKPFPVALCGCVPCKVLDENGAIKRGDLLTSSSTPGYAMKAKPIKVGGEEFFRPATIIGKALGSLESGRGVVEIFIGL